MLSRRQLANALRALSMDAVQKANSGHPGAPMGMADMVEVLWHDFLRHNPANPTWVDRDRFVLSNGHSSVLLYALLHLSGYDLSMADLQQFRQLHAKTPGHPEVGLTPGVEATTGPLGQGLANALGMAIAERNLASHFNRDGFDIVNHWTYVSVGDGCLMEGISHEVCSLAGTLQLGKLIAIFDSNQISIDGPVDGWFTEDIAQRFAAYGWQVIPAVDGHAAEEIQHAIQQAKADLLRPSIICCQTTIGYGAPNKAGTAASHGAPLGDEEIALARQALDWEYAPFTMPDSYYQAWDGRAKGAALEAAWEEKFVAYAREFPALADEFQRRMHAVLPADWAAQSTAHIAACVESTQAQATRKASQNSLNALAPLLPELIGGSADLSESNLTQWQGSEVLSAVCPGGNYIHYGVREFAMCALNNGLALHGGFIPYGGTFLIFSDYARNAIRMAALMRLRQIFVLTHDSIGLGEDGPTHQPIEQAACLRLIPNLSVWRPADALETAIAWQSAIENTTGPSALLLSRQTLPALSHTCAHIERIKQGAYIYLDVDDPEAIVIAVGAELMLAQQIVVTLNAKGHRLRLISMPSTDLFDMSPSDYQQEILPNSCRKRVAIEAGSSDYWSKYVGLDGIVFGIDQFGESAPADAIFEHFQLTAQQLTAKVSAYLHTESAV